MCKHLSILVAMLFSIALAQAQITTTFGSGPTVATATWTNNYQTVPVIAAAAPGTPVGSISLKINYPAGMTLVPDNVSGLPVHNLNAELTGTLDVQHDANNRLVSFSFVTLVPAVMFGTLSQPTEEVLFNLKFASAPAGSYTYSDMVFNTTSSANNEYSDGVGNPYPANFIQGAMVDVNVPDFGASTTTPISCVGTNDGTITATITNATAPYTYAWSDGPATSNARTGLAPGNYTVTVTDANWATASQSFTVLGDILAPTVLVRDIPVQISPNGFGAITPADVDDGTNDNGCPLPALSLSRTTFTCADSSLNRAMILSNATLSVADVISLKDKSFSVEFMVKSNNGNGYVVSQNGGTLANQGLKIGFFGGNFQFDFGSNYLTIPVPAIANVWNHYVCTYDATTGVRSIYRDGTLRAFDSPGSNYLGTGLVTIGRDNGSTHFNGSLDNFRLWSKALSASEVLSLMKDAPATQNDLILNYNFQELTPPTLYNLVQNAHHATQTGGVASWGDITGEPVVLTGTDVSNNTAHRLAMVTVQCPKVKGNVLYGSTSTGVYGLSGQVSVALSNSGSLAAGYPINDVVDEATGSYFFKPVVSGDNLVQLTVTHPHGGINATDALLVMLHFVNTQPLTGLALLAAETGGSNAVNATDALQIAKRFTGQIGGPFTNSAGTLSEWVYQTNGSDDKIVVAAGIDNLINTTRVLARGDVNSSYATNLSVIMSTPFTNEVIEERSSAVTIETEGELQLEGAGQQIIIPLMSKNAMTVGAISLDMQYPKEALEITSITMASGNSNNLLYNEVDGRELIAWFDINPLQLAAGDPVMFIHATVKPGYDAAQLDLGFYLASSSEVSDANGQSISDFTFLMPKLVVQLLNATTEQVGKGSFPVSIQPNPVHGTSTITYTLPEEGRIQLRLVDASGSMVKNILDTHQSAGTHTVQLSSEDLREGFYIVQTILVTDARQLRSNKKIVVVH